MLVRPTKADGQNAPVNVAVRNVNGDNSNMKLLFACARLASSVISYFQSRTGLAGSDSLRFQS